MLFFKKRSSKSPWVQHFENKDSEKRPTGTACLTGMKSMIYVPKNVYMLFFVCQMQAAFYRINVCERSIKVKKKISDVQIVKDHS